MRWRPLAVAVLLVTSVAVQSGVVAADDDEWSDQACGGPVITESKTIQGTLQDSDDRDTFNIRLQKGQFVNITVQVPEDKSQSPFLRIRGQGIETRGISGGSETRLGVSLQEETVSFELWAKTDDVAEGEGVCFDVEDDGWETPYNWQITIERSNPDVTLFEVRELEDKVVSLQNEVGAKEQRISELESRVSELESTLQQKNDRINELESRVEELQSQSSDVSFDITVEPSGDSNRFVAGRTAQVSARSADGDVSKLSIEYAGQSYSVGADGTAQIPLGAAGSKEMTFSYQGTEETVTLDVVSPSTDNTDSADSTQGDLDGTDSSGNTGSGGSAGETTAETGSDIQDSDGDGVIDSEDYAPNDPEVQEKSDIQSDGLGLPGFTGSLAIVALIAAVVGIQVYRRVD